MEHDIENRSKRQAGVLLHISSLPGRFGIGEIGSSARVFVDAMRAMRLSVWQFLPLGPTGFGDSPYQSLSTFAGNELLIDIQALIDDGYLLTDEASALTALPTDSVDFSALIPLKSALLAVAAERFSKKADEAQRKAFGTFLKRHNALWLHDYALFRLLKSKHELRPWYQWPEEFAHRDNNAMQTLEYEFETQIMSFKVQQFLFHSQWQQLRQYANQFGIRLFADIPIYVAHDSADAWANRQMLDMGNDGQPRRVAGVPPDYFSENGQLWGNPLYDWQYHADTGYEWWIARMRAAIEQADLVRIDHFRGFESFWSIPADADTAIDGHWEAGPGDALFAALRQALGELPIVAEDLGLISEEVEALRDRNGLPGMAVLQFLICEPGFDVSQVAHNRVCYTGTHDNNTFLGWFRGSDHDRRSDDEIRRTQDAILQVTGGTAETVASDTIKLALSTPARIVVIPMQDYLALGTESRMNTPGTVSGNWRWRMRAEQISPQLCEFVAKNLQDTAREQLML